MLRIIGIEVIIALGALVFYEVVCIRDKLAAHKRHKLSYGEHRCQRRCGKN
jgi:hypothetical protein